MYLTLVNLLSQIIAQTQILVVLGFNNALYISVF